MREIKFRAWAGSRMQFCGKDGDCDFIIEQGVISIFGEYDLRERKTPDWPLMQFTGMTDMDAVDIYEGDIVQFTNWWFDGNVAETTLTGQIVYSDHSMSFQLKGVKNKEWESFTGYENDVDYLTPFSELAFEEADFKVIGNIYRNPELLVTK